MELSKQQFMALREEGYVVIPGAVSRILIDRARRAIHHDLGTRGMDPARFDEYRGRSYCPEVKNTAAISDLYTASPLSGLAASAFGERALMPVGGGQIALRFPSDATMPRPPTPHIDGADYQKRHANDQVPPIGTLHSFSMLCGVFLADIPTTDAGNFTVWPGTHRLIGEWVREHGVKDVATPENVRGIIPRLPDWPEPVQVTAAAGDAVLTHHFTAHGIANNLSPNIRYAVFFRLTCEGHRERADEVFREMWLEWEGLRRALDGAV